MSSDKNNVTLATADLFQSEIARLAAENDRLREAIRRLADQDATLSVCDGNVTVTLDATLTDAEREAIATAIDCVRDRLEGFDDCKPTQETLRGLLERLK